MIKNKFLISIKNYEYFNIYFRYYDKKECNKSLSYEKKKSFASGRSYSWTVSNKKPFKLKQSVKELEVKTIVEILINKRIYNF